MAKIAVVLSRALEERARKGTPGRTSGRVLARGAGWVVRDVICTCGPQDRSFEEQHSQFSIALVVAGTFQYRSSPRSTTSRELMTPGSLLLGNPSQCFECSHEHAAGDRCISFQYAPEYFERIVADIAGATQNRFHLLRIPPLRSLSPVAARACVAMAEAEESHANRVSDSQITRLVWEEIAIELASYTIRLSADYSQSSPVAQPNALARITKVVRDIEKHPDSRLTLGSLARASRLSPYYFLRMFQLATGVTPHQYILRARLREAAVRLRSETGNVLDISLHSGFGDVSNFNHAFFAEFGMTPREYRRTVVSSSARLQTAAAITAN